MECANCKYSKVDNVRDPQTREIYGELCCHRYAPRMTHGAGAGFTNWQYPETAPYDFCGEHEPYSEEVAINYIAYRHHGEDVFVREDLKGKHREHCLCYDCEAFKPNTPVNCKIAQKVYALDRSAGITTPVWECMHFRRKRDEG